MIKDDIIRMAVEAGFLTNELGSYLISPYTFEDQDLFDEFERFANIVAAAEREACAKVCEEAHWSFDDRNEYATAIRARGQE